MKTLTKSNFYLLFDQYSYNAEKHIFGFRVGTLVVEFELVPFNKNDLSFIDYHSSTKIDTSKRYVHINRRNFIYKPFPIDLHTHYFSMSTRRTQGFMLTMAHAMEAISYVSTAINTFYMYRLAKESVNFFDRSATLPSAIVDKLKIHITDVVFVLIQVAMYYDGKLGLTEITLIISSYIATKVFLGRYKQDILTFISNLVPGNSTRRHTQGKDNISFAATTISLLSILALGYSVEPTVAKSILTSIRSLGSGLLTAKTMEQVVCMIVEYLPDVLHAILCEKVPLLAMYSKLNTDEDFKKMLHKLIQLKFQERNEIFYNSHNLAQFFELRKELTKFCLDINNIKRGFAQLLKEYINLVDDIYKEADEKGLLPHKRKLPFVVWLSGDPGIGKSSYAKLLARKFVADISDKDISEVTDDDMMRLVYSFNSANKFFDGYNNQPIFILNDYLQFTQTREEELLIRFVDTVDCMLEPSSVDNESLGIKGEVRFTSQIIIVTSNASYLSSSSNVSNLQAFNRRRDVVVEMKWKPDKEIDYLSFDYSWANFNILPPVLYQDFRPRTLTSFQELGDYILDLYVQRLGNSRLLLNMSGSDDTLSSRVNNITAHNSCLEAFKEKIMEGLNRTLNFQILGLPVKMILPALTLGSAAYLLFKQMLKLVAGRGAQSLSGDVATNKIQKKVRSLKRVTMGYQNNIYEMANVVRKNMCRISTLMRTQDGKLLSFTMWCLGVGGTLYITPKHLWRRGTKYMEDGEDITIDFKGKVFNLKFKESNIYYVHGADIAIYNFFGELPPIKDISHMLVEENIKVEENGESAILVTPKEEISQITPVVAFIVDQAPYTDPLGEVYEGESLWQYNTPMTIGDCGSILMLTGKTFEKRLAGLHVAGDAYSGNSEVITKELYDKAVEHFSLSRATQGFCTNADYIEGGEGVASLEGEFLFLGTVKAAPYQNDTTAIQPSPLFEALQPHLTGPAVLSPKDPRLKEMVSPMLQSVSKYGKPIPRFDSNLMENAYRIVRSFYSDLEPYTYRKFSAHDSINATHTPFLEKLDLKTSAGYPWNVRRLKKEDLILNEDGVYKIKQELSDRINTCENLLQRNTMFPYTLTTTLKDERVSLEKVSIGKTRTFMNFPVEYTILMRMYFDDFIDKETKCALEIGTTSGVNIYSSKWNTIYNMLNKFEYALDGDFKAFDGSIRPEFFLYYAKLVNSFYNDEYGKIRNLLMQGCCFAPIFVLKEVYIKLQGNPSGSRVTTSFNSFVNRMYVVMSILEKLPQDKWTVNFFKSNFKMFAHGDDHLIGFSGVLEQYWNGEVLKEFMARHNIVYTSSIKNNPLVKHKKLKDCYYLKSYFVYDHVRKIYRAGLDKDVIQEMVSWQRDNTLESTKMIVNTALRYAYFWGYEYFTDIKKRISKKMSEKFIWFDLVDYEDLEIEYNHSDQLEFSYFS